MEPLRLKVWVTWPRLEGDVLFFLCGFVGLFVFFWFVCDFLWFVCGFCFCWFVLLVCSFLFALFVLGLFCRLLFALLCYCFCFLCVCVD